MPQPSTTLNGSDRSLAGRFRTARAEIEEQVVDYQAQLDELAASQLTAAAHVRADMERDAADDRRRFFKYQAVEKALVAGDVTVARAAFHSLVIHVERDELLEDERRVGTEASIRLFAGKTAALRTIFHRDFVGLILDALAGGRS